MNPEASPKPTYPWLNKISAGYLGMFWTLTLVHMVDRVTFLFLKQDIRPYFGYLANHVGDVGPGIITTTVPFMAGELIESRYGKRVGTLSKLGLIGIGLMVAIAEETVGIVGTPDLWDLPGFAFGALTGVILVTNMYSQIRIRRNRNRHLAG